MDRRTAGVRGGTRGTQVVERVRAAVVSEMAAHGFAGMTIDGVARAAEVNRTTIYRRWPTKADLLAAVVEPLLAAFADDDLLSLVRRVRDTSVGPEGRVLAEAVRLRVAELDDIVARSFAPFRAAAARAGAGEMAAHLAYSGIVMWEQMYGRPATDDECAALVAAVLPGHPLPDVQAVDARVVAGHVDP
ncbi:helix-turn-helix domain-containing protein [Actinoplanes sp. CA-131856]